MIRKFEKDIAVIEKLKSRPNLRDGMTDVELKKKYDEAARLIKEYINNVLIPDIVAGNIPADVTDLGEGASSTVQGAIAALKEQIKEVAGGNIPAGTIIWGQLEQDVKNKIDRGLPVSYEGEDPDPTYPTGYLDGQIFQQMLGGSVQAVKILLDTGEYKAIWQSKIPVSEGGTGKTYLKPNAILLGNANEIKELGADETGDAIFVAENGVPKWESKEDVKSRLQILSIQEGSYVGNRTAGSNNTVRTIDLGVRPQVLVLSSEADNGSYDTSVDGTVTLLQGSMVKERDDTTGGKTSLLLSGTKLTINGYDFNPDWFNENGETYKWVAIY